MKEWVEAIGYGIGAVAAMAVAIIILAAIFAAPGFLVLVLFGHDSIGFWNSAAAGLGIAIIIAMIKGSTK